LSFLRDVVFIGNPMYDEVSSRRDARIEILKYLPSVSKIDGEMVKPAEREEAMQKPTGL
jgi:dynein light chain 1